MIKGFTLGAGAALLPGRPTAPAARGSTSSGGSTRRRSRRRSGRRSPAGRRAPRRAAAAPKPIVDARGPHRRSSRRAAVDGHPRRADGRSVARRLHPADRDGRAARRRLRLAHHQEHPRGQGLHLLAVQRALGALSRRLLGGERRRDDDGDRTVDQGDLRGDRSAAGRAADGRGADGHPELPGRHLRAAELQPRRHHQPAASTWICTACRRPTPAPT